MSENLPSLFSCQESHKPTMREKKKNQNRITWWIVLYGTENQRNVADNLVGSLETNKLGENKNEKVLTSR